MLLKVENCLLKGRGDEGRERRKGKVVTSYREGRSVKFDRWD